ncbi:MAG: prepilin-type N-terminal cleavage/methylation domain-containing protein [Planctomycetota bacterium]
MTRPTPHAAPAHRPSRLRPARLRPAGFTLIELLVVISIIAILIGILLPILSRGKDEAKAIACASNLRQMAIGLKSYEADFRGSGPYAGGTIDWGQRDPSTNNRSWMEQLHDYLANQDFFSGCGAYPNDSPYHYFLSTRAEFVQNGGLDGYSSFAEVRGGVEERLIRFPSAFVSLGDNQLASFDGSSGNLALDADKDNYTFNAIFGGTDDYWEPQHSGTLNVAFADGHVARFSEFDERAMTYRYREMSDF